jgi:hypothetical protein
MSRKTVYVVRKDGLYLMSYRKSDIREFDKNGHIANVYTGVYVEGKKGARMFTNMNKVMELKRLIDGDAVESVLTEVDDNA